MSSSYSFPLIPLGEIVSSLSQLHILTIKSEDLSNPTFDIASSIYTAILSHLDPLGEDLSNADFGALELLFLKRDRTAVFISGIINLCLYKIPIFHAPRNAKLKEWIKGIEKMIEFD